MQYFTHKHTHVHYHSIHVSFFLNTTHTRAHFFILWKHTFFVLAPYTRPQRIHLLLIHTFQLTHVHVSVFSTLVLFHHSTHTYHILVLLYINMAVTLSPKHLSTYTYHVIFSCFRKLTSSFLDEISDALIPFSAAVNRIQESLVTI